VISNTVGEVREEEWNTIKTWDGYNKTGKIPDIPDIFY